MAITDDFKKLASADLFKEAANQARFVGHPFYFDYSTLRVLVNDKWKQNVGGIPEGAFLVAVFNGANENEVVLLRVLGQTKLPSDSEVVAAMVDHYKESTSQLDTYTKYEFMFSGLECRVLGSFYEDDGRLNFGADVDNFYSPNNYSVYKPTARVLELLVNFRDGHGVPGGTGDERIGSVRYSSSRRHTDTEEDVPVYVSSVDYLAKRTALFGMTRTGKSNTVKKIIEATVDIVGNDGPDGVPVESVGQIVFDVNGEYSNENPQDEGTALYTMYAGDVTRYSILKKDGFKEMKLNFYTHVVEGFELIQAGLADDTATYTKAFLNTNWTPPPPGDRGKKCRYERLRACYQCILHMAGFPASGIRPKFQGNQEINDEAGVDPSKGVDLDAAAHWFSWVWANYDTHPFFADYAKKKQRDWADGDLKALMRFLTCSRKPGAQPSEAGYRKLVEFRPLHTSSKDKLFERDIVDLLKAGKIVLVDLSQGSPTVQRTMSERLCRSIFADAMKRFVSNEPRVWIQMYFEEAHNLFPKKTDTDLTLIYNRIAKEGAKLSLGLIYATQEVSSISANVLKNTQNWFVSHLNNDDELREISKFYDFSDFTESLRRSTDKGFVRMKTDSNPFAVPVQIAKFTVPDNGEG